MNRLVIIDSIKVTAVVSVVVFMEFLFGDAVALPAQSAFGASPQEIHDSQNITFVSQHIGTMIFSVFAIFGISVCMLNYLRHGE